MNTIQRLKFFVLSLGLFAACRRDEPTSPTTPATPLDGRLKFVGTYDVYDTLSNWQYEMEISLHPGYIADSLFIQNWGDAFDVYCQQDAEDYGTTLNFGFHFGITDHDGHYWVLNQEYDAAFRHNLFRGDTLHMSYFKDNIAFYVADGVPYFSQSSREYAVKRDWE